MFAKTSNKSLYFVCTFMLYKHFYQYVITSQCKSTSYQYKAVKYAKPFENLQQPPTTLHIYLDVCYIFKASSPHIL